MSALSELLVSMPEADRRAALVGLSPGDLVALEYCWEVWARKDQLTPATLLSGEHRFWLMLAGRGSGKTRAAAEATRAEVEAGRRRSLGLISPTADTGRRDQVAALLQISPPNFMPVHEPSQRRLVWPNGAIGYVLSSEEPDRIRGLNLDWIWGDELTSWSGGGEDVWSNAQLALRVSGLFGHAPAGVLSTTPKRQKLLKSVMSDPATTITRASTYANRANLDGAALMSLERLYGGTTLGRQELLGEVLDDIEGALWNRAMLDRNRVAAAPETLRRVVIAIDPAGSTAAGSDETGIVVMGVGEDKHGYVLADASGRYSPEGWARQAVSLYYHHAADRIVAEKNFGGDMIEATIRSVAPRVPVKLVTASRGKAVRAEPIVSLYEQRLIHHVGQFPELEDQLCGWDPAEGGKSPDRLDALVWAATELMSVAQPMLSHMTYIPRMEGNPWLYR